MNTREATSLRMAPLQTPTDLTAKAVQDISGALNLMAADMLALYLNRGAVDPASNAVSATRNGDHRI